MATVSYVSRVTRHDFLKSESEDDLAFEDEFGGALEPDVCIVFFVLDSEGDRKGPSRGIYGI